VHVDEEYIDDSFNLTGLRKMLPPTDAERYQEVAASLDHLCLSPFSTLSFLMQILGFVLEGSSVSSSSSLVSSAVRLFGLVHARFVATARGGQLLQEKIDRAVFGHCPRVLCDNARLLPVGLSDHLEKQLLKLFCLQCQQLYHCPVNIVYQGQYYGMDGAYFGSSASSMLVLGTPKYLESLLPPPVLQPFQLRIYGFLIHPKAGAALEAAQQEQQQHQQQQQQQQQQQLLSAAAADGQAKSSLSDSDHGNDPVMEDAARNQKKRERGSVTKEAVVDM